MTVVCCLKLSGEENASELEGRVTKAFPNKANREYIEQISRRAGEQSKLESLASLLTLSVAIERLDSAGNINTDPHSLILERAENGKPYFLTSNLRFGISHSGFCIASAVSDISDIGIDIEATQLDDDRAVRLAQRYFTEQEASLIAGSPRLFNRIWTQKEAEAKLFGIPLAHFLSEKKKAQIPEPSDVGRDNIQTEEHVRISEKDIEMPVYFSFFEFYGNPITLCRSVSDSSVEFIELEHL